MTRRPHSVPAMSREQARERLEATLVQLFRDHYDALCDYAEHICGSAADGEDVVQGVFVALSERPLSEGVIQELPTARYLYGAVRNRAIDVIRHRKVESATNRRWTEGEGESVAGTWHSAASPTPEEEVMAGDLSRTIRAAIDQLPPRCRETFVLSRDHHLSYAEIAKVMGISVATVELQMGRALKALQEVVRRENEGKA